MLASEDSDYLLESSKGLGFFELAKSCLPLPSEQGNISVPLKDTEESGYSAVYRNKFAAKKLKGYLLPELKTVHGFVQNVVNSIPDQPGFSYRPYNYDLETSEPRFVDITYGEIGKMKDNLSSGILYHLQNCRFKQSDKYESHKKIDNHIRDYKTYTPYDHSFIVALHSSNRYEWLLSDMACSSYSISNTALYDTLGPESSLFILNLTEAPVVIASKKNIGLLIDLKQSNPEKLGHFISIISMDPLFEYDESLKQRAFKNNIVLHDIFQIMKIGEIFPVDNLPPSEETLYTISFTSGTSGSDPKGVCLTQGAAASSMTFVASTLPNSKKPLAFLPLTHIFERETALFSIACGSRLGFPQLNYSPETLIEDLKLYKPSRISLVPRVYNKFEAAIKNATIDNPELSDFKRSLFKRAFDTKMYYQSLNDGNEGSHKIYDNLIIKKIRQNFGFDNIEYTITGSAPIDAETVRFLKAALGFGLVQGYGLTETFAGFCLSPVYDSKPGDCGVTAVNTEVRIREIPEMGYSVNDPDGPRGELCVRGYQNIHHYYKNPEETKKAIDSNGWFYTGDVARIDKTTGRIYIIDRVKNFFKLAQGEYISPEKIENNYQSNKSILSQFFVHGDTYKNFLVGIVGIERQNIITFLNKFCNYPKDELLQYSNEKLLKVINSIEHKRVLIEFLNQDLTLKGFEKIKNLFIEFEPLSLARNIVTPTMKVKRPFAKKYFASVIDQLYEEGEISIKSKM